MSEGVGGRERESSEKVIEESDWECDETRDSDCDLEWDESDSSSWKYKQPERIFQILPSRPMRIAKISCMAEAVF